MKATNAIICPLIYKGTSFEDISNVLKVASDDLGMSIDFIGYGKFAKNTLQPGLLDNERYIHKQVELLGQLTKSKRYEKMLFLDFFQPGLDLIKYAFEQQGTVCKFGSLLHGGTFMRGDLYAWDWLSRYEHAYAGVYDTVYVPSKFLKSKCMSLKGPKIRVFPWGMDGILPPAKQVKKDIDVVFPHRLDADKGADEFIKIVQALPHVTFAVTYVQSQAIQKTNKYARRLREYPNVIFLANKSNAEYLMQLSRAKLVLSCALQETFGYAVMKAVAQGCVPIVPNNLSYPEFFTAKYLYKNVANAVEKIESFLKNVSSLEKDRQKHVAMVLGFSFKPLLQDFFQI